MELLRNPVDAPRVAVAQLGPGHPGYQNHRPALGQRPERLEAARQGLRDAVGDEGLRTLDPIEADVEALEFETGESLGIGHIYASAPDAPWIERDPERLDGRALMETLAVVSRGRRVPLVVQLLMVANFNISITTGIL